MWGRELRAGMVFVLASLILGGAFRSWERAHALRFSEIVESLVEADAGRQSRDGISPGGAGEDSGRSGAQPDSDRNGNPSGRRRSARPAAVPPRAASIDVDDAGAAELMRLPGIGPTLAARIVSDRAAHGHFGGPEGLLRVPGIGPKTLAKIRPYLTSPAESSTPTAGLADTSRAK